MRPESALERTLEQFFPGKLRARSVAVGDPAARASAAELACLGEVVDKRRAEFVAGRHAARAALGGIGLPVESLLIGAHRQPLPPARAVLSITHDEQLAVAVAAQAEHWFGLGVDLADTAPLPANLIETVCNAGDLLGLASGESEADRGKLVFCLKEALFKTIFAQVGNWMNFSQSTLDIDLTRGHYGALIVDEAGRPLALRGHWRGRFARVGDRWVALAGLAVDEAGR